MKRWFEAEKNGRPVRVYFRDLGERATLLFITLFVCEGEQILSGFDAAAHNMTAERRFRGDAVALAQHGIRVPCDLLDVHVEECVP